MVYERQCPNCGIAFKTDRITQRFCCLKCSNQGREHWEKEDYDPNIEWCRLPTDKHKWQRPYETEVSCKIRNCNNCGWNPEVAKERLEDYHRKYREEHYG